MEKLKSLYVDCHPESGPIMVDDFLIAIGKNKSNSVYHIAEVKSKPQSNGITRYYVKVYISDLPKALQRDKSQFIIPIYWYKRESKKNANKL